MRINGLITVAALAALGAASALPAQERDRRDRFRDRDREGQQSSAATRPAPSGYNERYAILEQRNIFAKDRSRPAPRTTAPSTNPSTRRSLEESLVVRGIAMEEVGYRAYLEDLNSGNTLRVSVGDALARGYVAGVALDAIAYEHDGRQTWIEVGSDLTGKPSSAPSPYGSAVASSSGAAATTSPTTLPANVDLNDPSLTVEQRMRLRVQLQQQQQQRGR